MIYAIHGPPSSYSRSNIETRCLQLPQLQVPSPQAVVLARFVMSLWKLNSKSRSQFEYYSALHANTTFRAPLTNGPMTIRSSYQSKSFPFCEVRPREVICIGRNHNFYSRCKKHGPDVQMARLRGDYTSNGVDEADASGGIRFKRQHNYVNLARDEGEEGKEEASSCRKCRSQVMWRNSRDICFISHELNALNYCTQFLK